jgi:hypothetical protein
VVAVDGVVMIVVSQHGVGNGVDCKQNGHPECEDVEREPSDPRVLAVVEVGGEQGGEEAARRAGEQPGCGARAEARTGRAHPRSRSTSGGARG